MLPAAVNWLNIIFFYSAYYLFNLISLPVNNGICIDGPCVCADIIVQECCSAVYQCALRAFKPKHYNTHCLPLVKHLLHNGLLQLPDNMDCYVNSAEGEDILPTENSGKIISVFYCNATARLLEVC